MGSPNGGKGPSRESDRNSTGRSVSRRRRRRREGRGGEGRGGEERGGEAGTETVTGSGVVKGT